MTSSGQMEQGAVRGVANSWARPNEPPNVLSGKVNLAARYDLPKPATYFIILVLISNAFVFFERLGLCINSFVDYDAHFFSASVFALALVTILCVGTFYMAWVYITRVNVFMLVNFAIAYLMLVSYHSVYQFSREAQCSRNVKLQETCLVTFYVLLMFTGMLFVCFLRIRVDMDWLYFKRTGALPKLRKLYSSYLFVRSSFSLNLLCMQSILVSIWKLVVVESDVNNPSDTTFRLSVMVFVSIIIMAIEVYGRRCIQKGIEEESILWVRRYEICSAMLPLFCVGVIVWAYVTKNSVEWFTSISGGTRINATVNVSDHRATGGRHNQIEAHNYAEFEFALWETGILFVIVMILRFLVWGKILYLKRNFGAGLPQKILHDKFYFTLDQVFPCAKRNSTSNISMKNRFAPGVRGHKATDSKPHFRTISGTDLGAVNIDPHASPTMPGHEHPTGKKQENYVLM